MSNNLYNKLKNKMFGKEGDCFKLKDWVDIIRENNIEAIEIEEMERTIGGKMWCKIDGYFPDDDCGNVCDNYSPCNGRSGRCRELINGYIGTGRWYWLFTTGKMEQKGGEK